MKHRIEAVDHEIALGLVDADGHFVTPILEVLVEHFRVSMQPADAGAVGGIDRQMQRRSRGSETIFDRRQQAVDPLPGLGRNQNARTLRRATGSDIPHIFALFRRKPVDLVPDFEDAPRMPAVLLEAGSIINRDEELKMESPERQDIVSGAVVAAAKEFCQPQEPSLVSPDDAATAPPRVPSENQH